MTFEGPVEDELNLPNTKTLRHVHAQGQHTFESVSIEPIPNPCCLLWSVNLKKNGFKSYPFVDIPLQGEPSVIHHQRRRWRVSCTCERKNEYEALPWVQKGKGYTLRAAIWGFNESITRSFSAVSERMGLQLNTVKAMFLIHARPAVKAIVQKTPRVLGLDEKHVFRGFRAVMGNVEEKTRDYTHL